MANYILRHFEKALELIDNYPGVYPLSSYLKSYFSENRKHGAKDRKIISGFCYAYYRLGATLENLPRDQKLKVAIFMQYHFETALKDLFNQDWEQNWSDDMSIRLQWIKSQFPQFDLQAIFPFTEALSPQIQASEFNLSILIQPDLFIRIRPGNKTQVLTKLRNAQLDFEIIDHSSWAVSQNLSISDKGPCTLAFKNMTHLDEILEIDKEVVIQDISSQRVAVFIELAKKELEKQQNPLWRIWDSCAASGGKSLLVKDVIGKDPTLVTDIRPSILHNLKQRYKQAGLKAKEILVADLSRPFGHSELFDFIICDVPCSGSGTWSRTPEQLSFFQEAQIAHFQELQQKIVRNCLEHLEPGGCFLYITCSVFSKENEQMVDFIEKQDKIMCIHKAYLKGYAQKGDTMFGALFTTKK